MFAILLDSRDDPAGYVQYRIGAAGKTSMMLRELVQAALTINAKSLVLIHNHPTGNSEPSLHDVINAMRLKSILPAFDLELIDFVIVTATEIKTVDLDTKKSSVPDIGNWVSSMGSESQA